MIKKLTKIITVIIIISLFSVWLFDIFKNNKSLEKSLKKTKITVKDKELNVFIADNYATRTRGLSIFSSIKDNEGMLFLYPEKNSSDKIGIWMQGMKFDIDIIWVKNNKIIHIVENASHPRNITINSYNPDVLADSVLEVNSGFVKNNNIKVNNKTVGSMRILKPVSGELKIKR